MNFSYQNYESFYQNYESLMSTPSGRYMYNEFKKKAIEVVTRNPYALKHESDWHFDADIVRAAIIADPFALRYAPLFQGDKNIVLLAVKINGLARVWAHKELQEDPDVKKIAEDNLPTGLTSRRTRKFIKCPDFQDMNIYYTNKNECKSLKDLSLINAAQFTGKADNSNSFFIRDSSVTLFGGKRLIPYSFKNLNYYDVLKASLPESANHFLLNSEGLCGNGFDQCNVDQAMINAFDFDIPFNKGKTCIEGGNCFLFNDMGERKAILGEISLSLSMVALEEQGYFDDKINEINLEPSLDALRIARNRNILSTKNQTNKIELNKLFAEPFIEEDKNLYFSEAKIIEVKLALTKICIAEELEIPIEKIIFLPQASFHLDMELFITPNGEIILNDDKKVINFLNDEQFSENEDKNIKDLLAKYKINAESRSRVVMNFFEKRELLLNSAKIRYRFIPAIFESSESKSALNYCNGIFTLVGSNVMVTFSDNTINRGVVREAGINYITTGPSSDVEKVFHLKFSQLFQQIFPEYKLHEIPDLSQFVSSLQGGIHCLTFENYLVTDLANA